MQYPSQQPSPDYPPAELYVQEQPSGGAPYQPSGQLRQGEEIIVGYNRQFAKIYMVVCIIGLIVVIALLPIGLIAGFTSGPFEPSDVLPLMLTLVVWLAGITFLGWMTRFAIAQGRSPKTVLLINHEGIAIQRVYLMRSRFVPWAEIESIYPRNIGYRYFCIQKRNRAFGSMILVPQMYLDRPVEEILQQLYYIYSSELSYYGVQLRS
jgi:hypothetical protein